MKALVLTYPDLISLDAEAALLGVTPGTYHRINPYPSSAYDNVQVSDAGEAVYQCGNKILYLDTQGRVFVWIAGPKKKLSRWRIFLCDERDSPPEKKVLAIIPLSWVEDLTKPCPVVS